MKYILVPPDIEPTNVMTEQKLDNGESTTFYQYVRLTLVNDPKFGVNVKTLFRGEKLCDLFRDASVGDEVAVEDDDYELMLDVAENPTPDPQTKAGFKVPLLGIEILPFIRAVQDATKKPRAAKKKTPKKSTKKKGGLKAV